MTIRHAPAGGSSIAKLGAAIWDNLYEVRVPYVDTLTTQHIKDIGLPTTGNRILDRQMSQDLVNVVISIDAIVEYYRRGVTVYMRNNNDTTEIYGIVNNYLLAWKENVENGLNVGNVPAEDLMLLDRFAEMLYPVASAFGAPPRSSNSVFANFYTGNGNFVSRGSFFAPTPIIGEKPKEDKHESVSGELAKAIATLRKQWN